MPTFHAQLSKAGIPSKFWNITTDKNSQKYLDSNTGLYLWGQAGTGKTVFACSMAKHYLSQGKNVRFWSSVGLIMNLHNLWRQPEKLILDFIESESIYPAVLILDDLGSEKLTEYVRTTFYHILNEREGWEKQTIITSNYSLDELDKYLGARISSRISGMCELLKFGGKDMRLKSGGK